MIPQEGTEQQGGLTLEKADEFFNTRFKDLPVARSVDAKIIV